MSLDEFIDALVQLAQRGNYVTAHALAKKVECGSIFARNCEPSHSNIKRASNFLQKLVGKFLVAEKIRSGKTTVYRFLPEALRLLREDPVRAREAIRREVEFV